NWDLPVVACAVGAVYAVHGWRTPRPLRERAVVAAVLLGLGFALKLYPGAFVAPLAMLVLTAPGRGAPPDWRGALRVAAAAVATVVLVNLPFALAGYEGWRASFTFQELRKVDITTNSVWYWGFRPLSDPANLEFQAAVDRLSPVLVVLSFTVALAVGWHRWRREGSYPWIGVSAAMLCGFLLLHKVHSPQYTLWLLPFFVLLRVLFAAAATVVLVNLPFAVAGYEGWRASFTFQELRKVDITTNSIWYWGYRPWSEPGNLEFQALVDRLSPALVLLSFALALAAGWWRWRREGSYPWIGVSAAMLCGFLLLHKVHSPQYTLWLLPFFVLLRVRWAWIVAYFVADLAMYIGIFRLFHLLNLGLDTSITGGFAAQAVAVGVWGRAALLVALFVVCLRVPDALVDDRLRSSRTGALSRTERRAVPLLSRRRERCSGRDVATGQSGSSAPQERTGSVAGRSTERTTSATSASTTASRARTAPRNQSGGRPRASGAR
ncbi:MAG TPA: glycosyltransferase 87 family protein, partial [Euzebyales bacterium]|nr:glycosyltransferase 87 family protein [Euzebyales bacterium]